jgi:quercetin dioxygenase-like cupin family protein
MDITAVLERRMDDTTEPLGRPPLPRRTPWAAPLLAVAGVVCIGLAATALGTAHPAASDAALQASQVTVTTGSYEAGHSSGWHVHPGLHSVVVLTGALTFYDERCERHHVGPGEAYLGGDRAHLVRNETPDPSTFVVTYARPPAALDAGTIVPPPTGCDLR